ncbi:MAG: putative spermidine/putrescine transport system ATP-binding protein, partial [Frankiales bacterium]|nr:putative spermidine/putrescine transport system ATP-binding protein [Frankiales bacterium]
ARQIAGRDGLFSIRPEKLRLWATDQPVAHDELTADGTVADVIYVGAATRFLVDLDVGGRLIAVQQNLLTSSADVTARRGERVRLSWRQEHMFQLPDRRPDSIAESLPVQH